MQTSYFVTVPGPTGPATADLVKNYGLIAGREIYTVQQISVPEDYRGSGHGSTLLRLICEDANEDGVVLEVNPTPSGGLNMTQLLRWFRRYGFEGHAGAPMLRYPGQFIPRPRTPAERELPSCIGCGDWGPDARLEPLYLGNPTEGSTVVGHCCLDCAERFRRLIVARYPSLSAAAKVHGPMGMVNRPSRTLRRPLDDR